MLKKLFAEISLISLFATSSFAQSNVVDEIVWVVGDEAILLSDVEEQRLRSQYDGMESISDPYCYIPEQLALQKLYLDEAKIDSLKVSSDQVQQQMDQRLNYLVQNIGSMERVESYFGKKEAQIRKELEEMIRTQITVQLVQKKIVGEVKATPSEVRRFVNSLPADSLPDVPELVEIQIISVQPRVRPEAVAEVKDKLHSFQERVEKGESSFSMLASLYSEDEGSARNGGELGFMGKGQLVPEFAEVAFALKDPKKVSRIVKSDFGYHIIQLIERQDERVNARHILLKPHIYLADRDSAKRALDSLANAIRLEKIKFEEAVALYSTDKNTKNSLGILANPRSGDTRFQLKEVAPDIAKIIESMNIGEISKTFPMKNSNGDEVYTIVKLKNRIPAHKANMTEDFQLLKNMCIAHKSQRKIDEWIAKKQETVYVLIYDKWKNCSFQYPGWIKKDHE